MQIKIMYLLKNDCTSRMQTFLRSHLMRVWRKRHAWALVVAVHIGGALLEDNLAAPPNFKTYIALFQQFHS